MANPQKENGYTAIANEIIDKIQEFDLNGTQFRILLCVWRNTYGFNRKEAELSYSILANSIKSSRSAVARELKILLDMKILIKVREAKFNEPAIIKFNKNYEDWIIELKGETVPELEYSVYSNQSTVPETEHSTRKAYETVPELEYPLERDNRDIYNINKTNKENILSSEHSSDGEKPDEKKDDGTVPASKKRTRKKANYGHDSKYYKAALWLAKNIEESIPGYKPHTESQIQSWADEVRLILETDKRDVVMANRLLAFARNDSFWKNRILSMKKFREQYDTLLTRYYEKQGS